MTTDVSELEKGQQETSVELSEIPRAVQGRNEPSDADEEVAAAAALHAAESRRKAARMQAAEAPISTVAPSGETFAHMHASLRVAMATTSEIAVDLELHNKYTKYCGCDKHENP